MKWKKFKYRNIKRMNEAGNEIFQLFSLSKEYISIQRESIAIYVYTNFQNLFQFDLKNYDFIRDIIFS